MLPLSPSAFMSLVGALVVAAWLLGIALNLLLAGYYDIAVRDIAMAVGAWSLHRLALPAYAQVAAPRTAAA